MYYVYIYLNILSPGNYTYQNLHFDQKIRKYANKGKVKEIKSTSIKQSKQSTINCVGWELINKKIIKEEVKLPKYKLISPDGLEHFIYSDTFISDKCSELNLYQFM